MATVILIGMYVMLAVVFTPVFVSQLMAAALGHLIVAVYGKARPFVAVSLLVFIITGFYLMLVNKQYMGIGRFDNTWSAILLIKHIVVLVMIGIGAAIQVGPMRQLEAALPTADEARIKSAVARLKTLEIIGMIGGVLVLLLTAIAAVA
jgi:hypothetical protein